MTPQQAKDQAATELFNMKYSELSFYKSMFAACDRALELMADHAKSERKAGFDEGVTKVYHKAMGNF
jgi:hypothetical protein